MIHKLRVLLIINLFVFGSCTPHPSPPPPTNDSSPQSNRATLSPTATPTAKVEYPPPDVQFVNVTLTRSEEHYSLAGTIRNNGPVDALFSGGCRWQCPPSSRIVNSGTTFAQGEILSRGQERSFARSPLSAFCDGPLVQVELDCSVEVRSWVDGEKGSQTKTVTWSGQVQIADENP